jgi:teichuronic acid biosynthesis glycosyltransferase TuaC
MIKVLFVCSGNSDNGISPITLNQGDSLENQGIILSYFTIKEKGIKGYLKAIPQLRRILKKNDYDVIHAHFSLSAFVASLAGAKRTVVSLMGSDIESGALYNFAIKFFNRWFWSTLIVKSQRMYHAIKIKDAVVIPNGVNLNVFKVITKNVALKKLGWDVSKTHILFGANPDRPEKNFKLAKEAFELLSNLNLELHFLNNIKNEDMPLYYNASDVVILTSLWEGSPNIIKEAMACNRPIVATDVGDIKWLLDDLKGCYISNFDGKYLSNCIKKAMEFSDHTQSIKGIEQLRKLELNSELVAERLKKIYISTIK